MIIEEVDNLKQWLVEQLQLVSEADPGVLAKYVIALLKKDESSNQEVFIEQLEVFLDDATVPFVRNLFEVIESKEYLPVPPKKKRVFTEVKIKEEEIKIKEEPKPLERKISIDAKLSEERVVEVSMNPPNDEDEKLSVRKRRFEDDRDKRKRTGRVPVREEDMRRIHTEPTEERRDNKRHNDRPDRTRSDEQLSRDRYTRTIHERVGYPKRRGFTPERRYSRSASPKRSRSRSPKNKSRTPPKTKSRTPPRNKSRTPPRNKSRTPPRNKSRTPPRNKSRSPQRKSSSPTRNDKTHKERCRDFDEKGYCLRGGLCPYDHGNDPVVVEESNLSSVLQAASGPPNPVFGAPMLFPPGETYNPDKPSLINNQLTLLPNPSQPIPPSHPLPPPPPINSTSIAPPQTTSFSESDSRPYIHTVKRAPSSSGVPRSFKLVDGSNIVTGAVVPVEPEQTTIIIRDIPYQSNDSALLAHHLGKFGPIKQLQCRVYKDVHTALVEYHTHQSAEACFNSNVALLGVRFIKFFWREIVPISLAPTLFKNVTKVTTPPTHGQMNLVNVPPPTTSQGNGGTVPSVTSPVSRESTAAKSRQEQRQELLKRSQGLLTQNVSNQKLILSKMENCKIASEKKTLLTTLKKLQESHDNIKANIIGLDGSERKRRPEPVKTVNSTKSTMGAATNLDLRPKEIVVKNCSNAEELQQHFSKFGVCTVIPSGVGIIIGFTTRRDAEMAYVKGRMVDNQELDIEWNKTDPVQPSQVTVEPIR